MDTAYIASGLAVGFLVGLTGVGGGSLMTPLLVFLFGFAPTTAVGTDLLFAAITKTGGTWVHHKNHRSVEWKVVGLLGAGSIPAAVAVIYLLEKFGAQKQIAALLTHTLGVALILTAVALLFRNRLVKASLEIDSHDSTGRFAHWTAPATVFTGLVLGVLVTLSSVGAGALGTVALLFLYPRLPTVKIVGTDLAHAIPLTAVAGVGHWHMATSTSNCWAACCAAPCRAFTWAANSAPAFPNTCCGLSWHRCCC